MPTDFRTPPPGPPPQSAVDEAERVRAMVKSDTLYTPMALVREFIDACPGWRFQVTVKPSGVVVMSEAAKAAFKDWLNDPERIRASAVRDADVFDLETLKPLPRR